MKGIMKAEEKYQFLYKEMAKLCEEQGWGDPFSYARSKEICAAIVLGHTVAPKFAGADAINTEGEEVEYKSTTGPSCKGAYTGISVQPSWEAQVIYLREEKLAKYKEHYFNRFCDGIIVESWVMSGDKVYETLMPKLQKQYPTVLQKKDPRLSAMVTWSEIKRHGKRVI